MKDVYLLGQTVCLLFDRCFFTKDAVLHIASAPSSRNVKVCVQQVVQRFENDVVFVNDNRSENMKEVQAYCADEGIKQ